MPQTTTQRKVPTDFTEGSITGSILKMGLPSMFGFLAQHIYAMTDMFWVSQLPQAEAGVAAITFFTNVQWILFSFNSLIGPGSVAIISRRYGEKSYDLAEKAIKETLLLKLTVGLLLGLAGWIFLSHILELLGARGESLALGTGYGRIMLVVLPILFATYSIFTALRGIANPNLAMGLMLGSNALNLILDPFLIFGWFGFPELGINGAAYASAISFCLTFTIGMWLFRTKHTNVPVRVLSGETVSLKSMWKMIRIGTPAWLGELSFSGSRMLITPMVAGFGTAVVAAYGVGMQLFAFGISILVGMGLGLSSLIGHNLGSEKYERAKATADRAIMIGVGVMSVLGIACLFGGRFYMGFFFDSPETISYGASLLRIMALGLPFFGAFITTEMIHQGVGLNTPTMVVSIIHSWGFQVVPALIVTQMFGFDQDAVWWVQTISGMISSTGFYLYYRRGRWLTVKV